MPVLLRLLGKIIRILSALPSQVGMQAPDLYAARAASRAVLSLVQASDQVHPWSLDAYSASLRGLIHSSPLRMGCADSTVFCRDGKYPLT